MGGKRDWRLAFYGDDFTGSTDALDLLARAGIPSVLFFSLPEETTLSAFPEAEAMGIAGVTRSLGPEEMEAALRPVFAFLKKVAPRHVHYKVCSTFDSSPTTGSLGKAVELGAEYFPGRFIPLLVGAPDLGRYCVFGNLFARLGTGTSGPVYRLDRHPSMSRHPVTPAEESDLRRALARQTEKRVGLFDLFKCRLPLNEATAALETVLTEQEADILLFDALVAGDLDIPGALMENAVPDGGTLFSTGSSAVETALVRNWAKTSRQKPEPPETRNANPAPILVLSGSCSPVTTGQIQTAAGAGFHCLALDTAGILDGQADRIVREAIDTAGDLLAGGNHVIVHTYTGPEDPRNAATREAIQRNFPFREEARTACPKLFGQALGGIAREILSTEAVNRLVIAGGDTSGYVAGCLGVEAVTVSRIFARGAPLCRMHAPGSPLHGKEINFKGGQVGTPDYFVNATHYSQPQPPS